jgi:hypothetical protein
MREFELLIDEALKKGLSPEPIIPFNSQFLSECLGFRCGRAGLEAHKLLTNPLPATVDLYYSWPFPQMLIGEGYGILIVRDSLTNQWDSVYEISEDHATVTHIFDIDELTFGKGTLMELADFGEYAFMTNGVVMIYWDTTLSAWQVITSSTTIPMMRTICNLKGQAIGGNVVSVWYDCDETFYAWSKIGSMDFTPDQDNEAGYRRDPFGGEVYHVRRLGDNVVGYSSKGITLLTPIGTPINTFKFDELHDLGLINRGAIGGSIEEHLYVAEDYTLWKMGIGVDVGGLKIAKTKPTLLGYQQYIEQLAGEDIIVSYDPKSKDFYIGNSTKTYLFSPYGLTEVQQHPSAVWRRNKGSYMLPTTVDSRSPSLCTEAFDMGYRGQKTIFSIESDVFLGSLVEAGLDYSHDVSTWNSGIYKDMNNQGIAAIIASGNQFRFRLRFYSLDESARISYIKARYKMTDLRGIRGVYAPGLRGNQKG